MRKLVSWFFGASMIVGLTLLLGSVGASELGNITCGSLIIRMVISFGLLLFGFFGLKRQGWENII